jgi:hypothetical protein
LNAHYFDKITVGPGRNSEGTLVEVLGFTGNTSPSTLVLIPTGEGEQVSPNSAMIVYDEKDGPLHNSVNGYSQWSVGSYPARDGSQSGYMLLAPKGTPPGMLDLAAFEAPGFHWGLEIAPDADGVKRVELLS